ncbi:high affinity immunoglobulin gamma Fc receptor I-like [Cetorhinus maximus]
MAPIALSCRRQRIETLSSIEICCDWTQAAPNAELSRRAHDKERIHSLFYPLIIRHCHRLSTAGDRPVVTSQPSGQLKEGEKFKLTCQYEGRVRPVTWYKDDKDMEKNLKVISDTAHSDTGGHYRCKVKWSWFSSRQMSQPLKVVTIAFDATLEIDPQRALLGDRIVLKCLISGWKRREYHYKWYKNNVLQENRESSSIYIQNAKHSDEATYRCEAEGIFRKQVSGDVTITVTDLCSTPTLKVEPGLRVLAGQLLRITCWAQQLHGDYPLLYSLFKDGQRLGLPAGNYTTGRAVPEDSGVYQCEVTSSKSSLNKKKMSLPISVSVEQKSNLLEKISRSGSSCADSSRVNISRPFDSSSELRRGGIVMDSVLFMSGVAGEGGRSKTEGRG